MPAGRQQRLSLHVPDCEVLELQNVSGYRDYPIPAGWEALLGQLEPAEAPAELPPAPDLTPVVDGLLALLPARDREVLWWRWVEGATLESTGVPLGGITRERVRQLEARAVRTLRANDMLIAGFRTWIDERGLCVACLRPGRSRIWPGATPGQLWQFMVNVLRAVTRRDYETRNLDGPVWTLRGDTCCSDRLEALLTGEPRFRSSAEVARTLRVSEADLLLAVGFEPELAQHAGGWFSWQRWNNADCLTAVAWFLLEHGVESWHFSQMARCLGRVWPGRFGSMNGRDVLGILSRPGFDAFQNAGRNGVWQLSASGDGQRNNRDAILAVLEEAGKPLSAEDIRRRLRRSVRPETLQALLSRDSAFRAFADGSWGSSGVRERSAP